MPCSSSSLPVRFRFIIFIWVCNLLRERGGESDLEAAVVVVVVVGAVRTSCGRVTKRGNFPNYAV